MDLENCLTPDQEGSIWIGWKHIFTSEDDLVNFFREVREELEASCRSILHRQVKQEEHDPLFHLSNSPIVRDHQIRAITHLETLVPRHILERYSFQWDQLPSPSHRNFGSWVPVFRPITQAELGGQVGDHKVGHLLSQILGIMEEHERGFKRMLPIRKVDQLWGERWRDALPVDSWSLYEGRRIFVEFVKHILSGHRATAHFNCDFTTKLKLINLQGSTALKYNGLRTRSKRRVRKRQVRPEPQNAIIDVLDFLYTKLPQEYLNPITHHTAIYLLERGHDFCVPWERHRYSRSMHLTPFAQQILNGYSCRA